MTNIERIARIRHLLETRRSKWLAKYGWVAPDNRMQLLDMIAKYQRNTAAGC